MVDPPETGLTEALAKAGWAATLDRIRARAVHDLNGRVSSLLAVSELARGHATSIEQIVDYLGAEVTKLERLSGRLRALRADPSGPAEPAAVDELTASIAEIAGWQRGLEGVEIAMEVGDSLPPVLVGRERLSAVLLILAGRAGLALAEGGGRVVLAAEGREEGVSWTVSPDPRPDDAVYAALGSVLEHDGGRLEREPRTAVWIPTLARARAEGR